MSAERDVEETYSMPDFIAKLRQLADALENGAPFMISVEGEEITIPKDAVMSVEHEREDGFEVIEFQLSWASETSDDEDDEEDEDSKEEDSEEEDDEAKAEEDESEETEKAAG